jgi:hypothetical protein
MLYELKAYQQWWIQHTHIHCNVVCCTGNTTTDVEYHAGLLLDRFDECGILVAGEFPAVYGIKPSF